MKNTYTKKQITEAIRHWKSVLRKMNESSNDAITLILNVSVQIYDVDGINTGLEMTKNQLDLYLSGDVSDKYNVKFGPAQDGEQGMGFDVEVTGKYDDLEKLYTGWLYPGATDKEFRVFVNEQL